jgi:hypothetical protein
VIYEREWNLPSWSGKSDLARELRDALVAALPPAARAAADERFLSAVTFLDPTFRRVVGGVGHLNSTCKGVAA